MKLTIAFITKDRCRELERAINSCIAQKYDSVQYIVVDNGSTDGTIDYLGNLQNLKNINLKVFRSDINLGVAGGRNKAMEMADGEYVFFLDDDAIIETENLLSVICNYMDENEQVAALALRTYEEKTERYLEGALPQVRNEPILNTLQFIGCAHVLRKAVFNNEILYPSKLGYGSEELYASLRIWNRNYEIKYLSDVMVRHIPSSSNRLVERERQYNILTNIYIVKMLTYPMTFRIITKLIFMLRLAKNNFIDKKTRKQLRKDVKYRFQKSEIDRISYKKLIQLGTTFGWKNIL